MVKSKTRQTKTHTTTTHPDNVHDKKHSWVKHHRGRNIAILSVVTVAVVLVAIGLSSMFSGGIVVGQQAPDFAIQSITGSSFRLYDHMNQPMFLEFMTTSCSHCTNQAPILSQLWSKYGNKTMFISISIDAFYDTSNVLSSYSQMHNMPWTFARDVNGLASTYGVRATPTMFVLGRNCIIKFQYSGETDLSTLQNAVAALV